MPNFNQFHFAHFIINQSSIGSIFNHGLVFSFLRYDAHRVAVLDELDVVGFLERLDHGGKFFWLYGGGLENELPEELWLE